MDELELLKKDWKQNENQFETFSDSDIYKMSHKNHQPLLKHCFTSVWLSWYFGY